MGGSDITSDSEPEKEPSAPECCTWLLEAWLTRALEDAARETSESAGWAPRTLPTSVRTAAWRMCRLMKATGASTPPLAARLLERYLAASARNTLATLAVVALKTGKDLGEMCSASERGMLARLPLSLMSCVQIAGKMMGVDTVMSAQRARAVLFALRKEYALSDVVSSEHAVFALLGYKAPLWTSVEAAEMLGTRLGVWTVYRKTITATVRLAELGRKEVERRVRWAGGLPEGSGEVVTDLLLAASALGAALRLQSGGLDCSAAAGRMADLIHAPRALLCCAIDVIVTLALE